MVRADEGVGFLLRYENVAWYEDGAVQILDRRIYPIRVEYVTCTRHEEVAQAIADMVTQSAGPYTAVGMGMALAAWEVRDRPRADQRAFLGQAARDLAHARPTTANRYGQITYRCAEEAEAALAAGREPSLALRARPERLWTVLEVRDNGGGIPPELQSRIYEPFFTSKNTNYNWGMGLSYVRRIVKSHLGRLRLESRMGEGSCFFIMLPLYDAGRRG